MREGAIRNLAALALVLSALILASCSTGPEPPKVGTPPYYWAAAKENYAAGDYLKAMQHLDSLIRNESEYTARAFPWYLVLNAGMAKGYMELADNFEYGMKANRPNATAFRRQMNDYRTNSNRLALQFGEAFEKFEATNRDATIVLDFAYPPGNVIPSPQLQKIASGQILQPGVIEDIRRSHLQTSLVIAVTRAVGAPEDTAKTQDLFKTGKAEIPREVFMTEMANVLHDNALLYGRTKLDDPKRAEFFATHALEALKPLPESKNTKALTAKIEKTLKLVKQ